MGLLDDAAEAEDISAAAVTLLPFALLSALAHWILPPSAEQMAQADPLVRLLNAGGVVWLTPLLSLAAAVLAWRWAPPSQTTMMRALRFAALGLVVATVVAGVMHLVFGEQLPAFIPPEESAKPGLTLGLNAGLLEEVVFRLGAASLIYLGLRERISGGAPIAVATVTSALFLAQAHELGPGGGAFDPRFFATRALLPGAAMSLVFLRVSPAFLVVAHVGAHLWIPYLFR